MQVFGTKIAQTVKLDAAINGAVDELSKNLNKGSKAAILTIRSASMRMSSYIIEELASVFVNQRLVTMVDRAQITPLQQEYNFQISGEVSAVSAQAIGKKLGAQSVLTGSFESVGNYYRFRVQVIDVETAAIMFTHSVNVRNDAAVASLMGSGRANDPASAPSNYEDFTTTDRAVTWMLNAFTIPGLGSYIIMKDKVGGTVQLIMGIVGYGLLIGGKVCLDINETYSYYTSNLYYDSNKTAGITLMSIGGVMLGTNFIFNIVRSAVYHKPYPKTASLIDPAAWNIAILPGKDGIEKVQVSYTMRF